MSLGWGEVVGKTMMGFLMVIVPAAGLVLTVELGRMVYQHEKAGRCRACEGTARLHYGSKCGQCYGTGRAVKL